MNFADREACLQWFESDKVNDQGLLVELVLSAWQAALEWRDSQNTLWRNAAIRVGEDLHSVGPNGYYNMSAEEWLNWALNTIYSKPNFAPPSAQINQQLVQALEIAETEMRYAGWGTPVADNSGLANAYEAVVAALAATQMRGDA